MLEQVEFKDFRIGELFDVYLSKGDNKISDLEKGIIPLVSSGGTNNGIVGYVKTGDEDAQLFSKNSMTVDMFGNCFTQVQDFYAVSHGRVNILNLKGGSSAKILLYICSVLNKSTQNSIYGFSNMLSSRKLQNLKISLPVTSSGSVNYSYMESYISYIEKLHISRIEKLHISRIERILKELGYNSLKDAELTAEDKEIISLFSGGGLTLAEFKIGELFEIFTIPQIPRNFMLEAKESKSSDEFFPYVTQKKNNNGIAGYIRKTDVLPLTQKPVILLGVDNVSNGVCFYHDKPFYANKMIALHHEKLNKKIALYFISYILKQYSNYSYSRKISLEIIKKTTIPLPINPQSPTIPNYQLMESYITAIEKLHVNKLISSHNQEITTLNNVTKKCKHKNTQENTASIEDTSKHM